MKLVNRLIVNGSTPFMPISSGTTDISYNRYRLIKYPKPYSGRRIEWFGCLKGVK